MSQTQRGSKISLNLLFFEQKAPSHNTQCNQGMKAENVLLSLKTMEILGRRRVTSLGGSFSYLEHKGWLEQSSGFLRCWLQHIRICLGLTPHCSLFAELLYINKMKQTTQVTANLVTKPTASEKEGCTPHF